MAGYLADINLLTDDEDNPCTLHAGTPADWAVTAPLEALRATPLGDYAVTTRLGTAANPVVFDARWASPIDLTGAHLLDANLNQESFVRIEAFADLACTRLVATTRYVSGGDRRVVPGLFDPATLRPGSANWLRGGLPPRDFRLYSTNIHAIVPACRARVVRWSLWGGAYRPDRTPDSVYRIGLAWAGDGLAIEPREGSSNGLRSNTKLTDTDGGWVWAEPGLRKRTADIDLSVIDPDTRDTLFDARARAGNERPVIHLPDTASPADCFRYGGLFRFVGDHTHKHLPPFWASTVLSLLEWKE